MTSVGTRGRFAAPSSGSALADLRHKARLELSVCLFAAALAHGGLSRVVLVSAKTQTVKPLTTQFVKRRPRLSKPLELKKRPRPKQRRIHREMVAVQVRADLHKAPLAVQPQATLHRLARPEVVLARLQALEPAHVERQVMAQAIEGSKDSKDQVDMSLELLDIQALDTGEYYAMVIQDPRDKHDVRGFFHLALTYTMSLLGGREIRYINWDPRYTRHLTNLCDAMNRYTQIKTDFRGMHTYDDGDILKVPWIYASAFTSFDVTASEAENLGRYLLQGGFFFADVVPCGVQYDPRNAIPMDRSLRRLYRQSLRTQGWLHARDWDFGRLPNTHPIYHCFFDFDDGPPIAGDLWYGVGGLAPSPFDYLEGITIQGRLVGILSNKFYQDAWGHQFLWADKDPTRPLQFGVNAVVFALTQEGSITHRVMDTLSR